MRIRIRLDEINFIVSRQSQIDPRVTVDREQTINVFADLLDLRDQNRLDVFRELTIQPPSFPIFPVPLRLVSRDLRFVRRHFAKYQLADRKNSQPGVAHQAHIKLAPVDVFLRDRIGVVFLVNERDPFAKLLLGLDERRSRNSVGRLFFHRLYQNWKPELPRSSDPLTARDDDEVRRRDSVMPEDFFRDAFVLAKSETSRAATGKRHALHLEQRNDVLVESRIVFELLDQVEKNVRLEAFH